MTADSVIARARDASPPALARRTSAARLAAEVRDGLARRQRELPSSLLADRANAEVRRAVERLADERLHGMEAPLIRSWATSNPPRGAVRRVVELRPSGSRSILPILHPAGDRAPVGRYLSVDPSPDLAMEGASRVATLHPGVATFAVAADPTLTLPVRRLPGTTFACLGGNLGRYAPVASVRVLRALRAAMTLDDVLLIGLDQRSPHERLAATAALADVLTTWYRHALALANRAAGTDFRPEAFRSHARYDAEHRRIEQGLVPVSAMWVSAPPLAPLQIRRGELVRLTAQYLYDRAMLQAMLRGVGLVLQGWNESPDGSHALAIATVRLPDDGLP